MLVSLRHLDGDAALSVASAFVDGEPVTGGNRCGMRSSGVTNTSGNRTDVT